MKSSILFIFGLFLFTFAFVACEKESFYTGNDAKLAFSKDTLRFDTVFTAVGSATRSFKILNPYDKTLIVNKIFLEKGEQSIFNLNIDGISGDSQTAIEIPANDSIYVFAEVTINPNDQNNPFILNENIIFETNGVVQKVVLEAWGQNANYIPNKDFKGKIALIDADQIWDDPKPYVIYGTLVIDNAKLTLPAGTRVYVHGGLVKGETEKKEKYVFNDGRIYVINGGSIDAQGTKSKPVLIGGDRLEKDFENTPAQWNLMYFGTGCSANFTYTTVKNSRLGVYADSLAVLDFKYSKIYNTAGPAIYARQAEVTLDNCLMYNNGASSLFLEQGGNTSLTYCTLANYGNNASSLYVSNTFCKRQDDKGNCIQRINFPLNFNAQNCIVASSQRDALDIGQSKDAAMDYAFDHCVLNVEKILEPKNFPDFLTKNCKSCFNFKNSDRLFKSKDFDNYKLDTLSVAEMKAIPIPNFNFDLDGTPRDAQKPDVGAYEYKPK